MCFYMSPVEITALLIDHMHCSFSVFLLDCNILPSYCMPAFTEVLLLIQNTFGPSLSGMNTCIVPGQCLVKLSYTFT